MNTPTPKTDAEEACQTQRYGCMMVKSDFARDLERQNTELRSAISEFLALLEYEEESDSGALFHPIHISCCRVAMERHIEKTIERMQEAIK